MLLISDQINHLNFNTILILLRIQPNYNFLISKKDENKEKY